MSDLSLWPAADRHYIVGRGRAVWSGHLGGADRLARLQHGHWGVDGGFSEVGRGVITDLQLTEVVGQIRSRRG